MGAHFNTYSYTHTYSKLDSYTNTDSISYSCAQSDSQASSYATPSPNAAMNEAHRICFFSTQQFTA